MRTRRRQHTARGRPIAGRRRIEVSRRTVLCLVVALLAVALTACAAGPNPEIGSEAAHGDAAGFWYGLWHGIIAPITFIISLFNDNVNIYEVHNSGNWYNFGFMLGVGVLLGGGSSGARSSR